MCVRVHGLERVRTVADPFMGLGSTAVACATLGTSFVGIELDEGYLKEAVDRVRTLLDRPEPHPRPPEPETARV